MSLNRQLFSDIREYLSEYYEGERLAYASYEPSDTYRALPKASLRSKRAVDARPMPTASAEAVGAKPAAPRGDLKDRLENLDESFQEALLRLIDERGIKDSDCYKRAGVDRKLFSKIRSNPLYRPSKPTAVAFAIALELSLRETQDLLRKAGYALSHSSKFDVIVEYFIINKRYDLQELNEALYEFDQPVI